MHEILAIDIGNTRSKACLMNSMGEITKRFQDHSLSREEIQSLIDLHPKGIISDVSGSVEPFLNTGQYILLKGTTETPLRCTYERADTLGPDRLALANGAWYLYPGQHTLIISLGTCITYDLVLEDGSYPGGAISPGLQMRYRSLHQFTGKLPLVEHRDFSGNIGKNTEESILAGVQRGIAGEIEAWIRHMKHRYQDLNILFSGGDAASFGLSDQKRIFAAPDLMFQGLFAICRHHGI
ncbi:MAG: type III pantothenate kinase [Bacteroidetes bacterium]|nr:type III pantothenate kinase [Bacteroidota bacterium]